MRWLREVIQHEEGSALATVLVIAVIISLFIGAILAGIVLQARFIQRDINSTKALYAAEEGAYRYLSTYTTSESFQTTQNILLANGSTANVKVSPFGGFLDIRSSSTISKQQRNTRILAGGKSLSLFDHAIALGDTNTALTVTGSTNVTGSMIVSVKGIQTESFKGVPFRGELNGEAIYPEDKDYFPTLNTQLFDIQEQHFNALFESDDLQSYESRYDGKDQSNSIQKGDTLFYVGSTEWISNQRIHFPMDVVIIVDGNFIINGEYHFSPFTKIIVSDTLLVGGAVSGKNTLMYAGKSTQIGGGTSISSQVISSGNIVIRDDAYLQYPSLVYSSKEFFRGGDRDVITIQHRSIVDGTVIYPFKSSSFTQDLFRIRVDTNATVRGSIYNNGQTELLGKVSGSVLTQQFYFYESPTSYINWLKDVTINVNQRPENYVLPLGFSDSTNFAILDWYETEN